jgi:DNA-binding CsgD family transcriptional regulator
VGLTPAETRVLELLCAGVRPTEIAGRAGVAVSTVRTQIGSIRAKTGAASIRELVRQVAVLPPLVGALRNGFAAARA